MRKITLGTIVLVLTMAFSSVAFADRDERRRDQRFQHRNNQGPVVRDHRWNRGDQRWRDTNRVRQDNRWRDNRWRDNNRRWNRGNDRVVVRHHHHHHNRPRTVYVRDGYFTFGNNIRHRWVRPVIVKRYYDYRYRPQPIVEQYASVDGYIWVPGQWRWNGYEWQWISGHYEVDPAYLNSGYDYDGDGYADDGYQVY